MSSGMPELGSKISLISKADIRYEGRLFTVDPQECTIALASVRSFGTEDRETQYPVAPQSQVYDYILFRGSDIKDIRVLNNVPSLPNDPAIMQMSVPPSLGGGAAAPQFTSQYNHPVVGQTQYPQYHPMAGFPAGVHTQLNKTSELSPQSVDLASQPQTTTAPIGSGVAHHTNQVKDQGSMLDLIGGGSQQHTASRSGTPAVVNRKSPTADQGTQVGAVGGPGASRNDNRRGSSGNQKQGNRNRASSRNRQRYPSGSQGGHGAIGTAPGASTGSAGPSAVQQNAPPPTQQYHHQTGQQGYNNRGGWRGRARGRGRGFIPRNKNTLKFDNDYDFEQANTEFEELRSQLAKTKISEGDVKVEGEADKKDDSGNETGAGEPELDEEGAVCYDKNKSFFDNISCEAVERSKGRSQRTDWRTERKLNSETFGVASARRGAWRGRGGWRHNPHHQPMSYFPSWRAMRGGRGRPHAGPHPNSGNANTNGNTNTNQQNNNRQRNQPSSSAPVTSQPQATAAAK